MRHICRKREFRTRMTHMKEKVMLVCIGECHSKKCPQFIVAVEDSGWRLVQGAVVCIE